MILKLLSHPSATAVLGYTLGGCSGWATSMLVLDKWERHAKQKRIDEKTEELSAHDRPSKEVEAKAALTAEA
ncbi:hypothetical protein CCACVL1_26404 [Corchorus capsularis]|uniref:Uncharacterized protein n=1 Tax=Corchorus capsularis TaxID=210143 RepID=A0A1R3GEX4_COCAP|nr:hypothetical protein CCACVL1_26404 [Corchorus capsularis]